MLKHIAAFELRYQLRSPLFVVSFLIFFLLSFAAVTVDGVQIGARGNTHLNSPHAILQTLGIMNVFAIFTITAFVANVVIRDDETGFAPMLRATRVGKFDYLLGRFCGAMLVTFLVSCAVPLGMLLGCMMPWLDAERLGPLVPVHYLYAQFAFTLPTLLLLGAGFFALATATRSMMWTYVGAVGFLILMGVSGTLLSDPAHETLSAMADPFGLGALDLASRYWTAAERNTRLPEMSGLLLYNRLLWLGVGGALFLLAYSLFRFESKGAALAAPAAAAEPVPPPKPLAAPRHDAATRWLQLRALTRFDLAFVFKSPAFFILLLLGLVNALATLLLTATERGVDYLPVTRALVGALQGAFGIIPMIVAIYYAGELVWRSRERRMHEIVDASAAPNWTFMLPKVLAITLVLLASYLVAMLGGMLFQLAKGYTALQPGALLLWFVLPGLIHSLLLAVLVIFVQALAPHKFAGWGFMLLFIVANMAMSGAGFEHHLYRYAAESSVPLSDMNGMGTFWIGRAWLQAYWLSFGAMLLVGAHLMWRRGAETRLKPRLALLGARLAGAPGLLLGGATLAWLGTGAFVFYNTNLLNAYETRPMAEQRQADFEKTLLPFEALPEPSIKDVKLQVELYPEESRAVTRGSYVLENRSGQAVRSVHVEWNPKATLRSMSLDGAALEKEYPAFGHRVYRLATPMLPGERRSLRFETVLEQRGFVNGAPFTRVVGNGSFVHSFDIAPFIGVSRHAMLRERAKRRKHGLPAELAVAKLEDDGANAHHNLRRDSDWVNAEISLSTDADQTPVAPGYTLSDTTANGRRTLLTRSEAPIHNYFSLVSARYAVARDEWRGADGKPVQLAVYHHPAHASNVRRMLDAMKASLDLFGSQFSPYQFRQARIMEFPAYASYAEAFAGTVPFSEAIGFIQDFKDVDRDEKIDLVTYVTAHEIAHQWWGHQLVGADKQGATMLSETFAQYSALLVMEKLYGKEQIRKFLKDQLDQYLAGRAHEALEERPLARVEGQQYIHYNKGAVVMYALKEMVGADVVQRTLQKLLGEFAFKGAPYPDSRDFLRLLRAEAGPRHAQLIADLFERITLYDLKASAATSSKRADGKFDVAFTVEARKFYADGKGKESESALAEDFDVGAFTLEPGKKGYRRESVLLMERRPLRSGKQVITMVLERTPAFVGVDPYNMRIDRNSDDNLSKVVAR